MIRSIDGGLTWADLGDQLQGQHAMSLCAVPGGTILAGTDQGQIFKSEDYGLTWYQQNSGNIDYQINSIAHTLPDQNGEYKVFVAGTGWNAHILQSLDGGLNWSDKGGFASGDYIKAIACTASSIFVAAIYEAAQIIYSTDYGSTWNNGPVLSQNNFILTLYSPLQHIVLAGEDGGERIYRSVNDGQSFSLVFDPNRTGKILTFLDLGGGVIEAIPDESGLIFKSTDYGKTWTILTDTIAIEWPTAGASAGGCKACIIGEDLSNSGYAKAYKT